ncbi:hypothetical protein BGW80DRAFT_1539426 [Lactifluus volemus]|nr:hypothetical protein BGW80DRAFT_1539426 [Lactifluus volemus]
MADEQFKNLVSDTLYSLFSSSKIHTPVGSLELLSTAISADLGSTPSGSMTSPKPRFRLTDCRASTKHWDRGSISIVRDDSGVTVTDVHLGSTSNTEAATRVTGKRKRVKDEDADSAAGSGDEAEDAYEEEVQKPCTTLANLPKDLKEVYAFLQRSTAKGRLLAEQFRSVKPSFEPICEQVTKEECAKIRSALPSPLPGICDRVHFRPLIRPHTDLRWGIAPISTLATLNQPTPSPFHSSDALYAAPDESTVVQGTAAFWPWAGGRGKERHPADIFIMRLTGMRVTLELRRSGRNGLSRNPIDLSLDLAQKRYWNHGFLLSGSIVMFVALITQFSENLRYHGGPTVGYSHERRAMEIGRECLRVWGYTRVDEVVWVKTNQVGLFSMYASTTELIAIVNSSSASFARQNGPLAQSYQGTYALPVMGQSGLDTDVIVSEVRETSRKPDEVYGLIERCALAVARLKFLVANITQGRGG